MTPEAEAIIRRMVAVGYLPTDAIMAGLRVTERDVVRLWTEQHHAQRPEREVVIDEVIALAQEVTGEPHRRTSSALFALTQAAFGKGDVALPSSHVDRVLSALEAVQRLGLAEDERSASVIDAAIRRLDRRAALRRLSPR